MGGVHRLLIPINIYLKTSRMPFYTMILLLTVTPDIQFILSQNLGFPS